jgi:FkbM family methyltransferase
VRELVRRALPRRLGSRRILGGPLRGRRLVTSWHDYPAAITGRTELPLLHWFAAHVRAGETWLDIGGHYGYTSLALAEQVGRSGRVFTFEPVAASAGCISQTRLANRLEQITVVPIGLGSPESLEVQRLPITRGMADMTLKGERDHAWWESIPIARFDWLWPRLNSGDARVDGLKIDVQGMELDVLSGMSDLLQRQKPSLVVELHTGVDRDEFRALLERVGYSTKAIPIDTDQSSHTDLSDNCSYAFVAST